MLVPLDADESQRGEETAAEEVDEVDDSAGLEDATPPEPASARRKYLPSSIALSVLVAKDTSQLNVIARWGDYHLTKAGDGHGSPVEWKRTSHEQQVTVDLTHTSRRR